MRKIIIPAGGNAQRFNGILKELSPLDNEGINTPLLNTISLAVKLGATDIKLITNPEKKRIHIDYIYSAILPRYDKVRIHVLTQQERGRDLLDAVALGLESPPYNTAGGLLLPDTVTDFDIPEIKPGITFGTFDTQEPARFTILADNALHTKKALPTATYKAWGVILWSPTVGLDMTANHIKYQHYDELFNAMLYRYGYHTFPLKYYYDLGSIEAYLNYMDNNI